MKQVSLEELLHPNFEEVGMLNEMEHLAQIIFFLPVLLLVKEQAISKPHINAYQILLNKYGFLFNENEFNEGLEFLRKNLAPHKELLIARFKIILGSNEKYKQLMVDVLYLFAETSTGIPQEQMDRLNQLEIELDL